MENDPPIYVPDENGPELPLPPTLPNKPFTFEECTALLDEVTEHFPNPHDALEELMACGSSLFEDVEELLDGRLSGEQFTILMPILIQVAFVFAHPGTLQPELNLDTMEEAFEDLMEERSVSNDDLIADSKQPHLLNVALRTLAEFNSNTPKGQQRLSGREMQIVSILLRVVIDEFDAAMRVEGAARD